MSATIPGWSPEIERGFKEILFRFLEEIQCTRAALYFYGPGEMFLLATQYGFGRRDPLAIEHGVSDPMVARVRELRGMPMAYNTKADLGTLADYLKSSDNAHLLLVPLMAGSEVIGFVDARDKGRRRAFERTDVTKANKIAAAMVEYARHSGFVFMDDEVPSPSKTAKTSGRRPEITLSRAPMLDESSLENVHDAALDCLFEHQVMAVAVTLATPEAVAMLINTREGGADIDRDALCRHQAAAFAEVGVQVQSRDGWRVEVRRVPMGVDTVAAPMIASAVLLNDSETSALTGSVVSGAGANAARATLARLRARAEDARDKSSLRFSRRCLARRLVEPGLRKFPDLVAHSEAVSRLSMAMARELDLGPTGIEEATLAGLLHDIGMRELDYERTYSGSTPSEGERMQFQKHPVVGATILEGTGLDEVTAAVRHHHERWDGTGYPDRLEGEAIPSLSRLVHVAEVFDVLSVPGRYRPTVSVERALEIIKKGAGSQFDPRMVEVLTKVVP